MTPPAHTYPHLDAAALPAAAQTLFSLSSLGHLLSALFILALALLITQPSAQACAAHFHKAPAWLRWPLRLLAQTLAFFPLTALSLSLAGYIVSAHGWPLPSLMPMENEPGLATWLWYWAPPLLLLCVPLHALAFAQHLSSRCQPRRVLAGSAALAAVGILMLAESLQLIPTMPTPALAVRQADAPLLLHSLAHTTLLALCGIWLTGFWPVPVKKHQISAATLICESARVIGLTPWQIWWRHQLPMLLRPALALLLDLSAWALALAGAWAVFIPLPYLTELHTAGTHWLQQPSASIIAAAPVVLCSLSLWLAARIVRHGTP